MKRGEQRGLGKESAFFLGGKEWRKGYEIDNLISIFYILLIIFAYLDCWPQCNLSIYIWNTACSYGSVKSAPWARILCVGGLFFKLVLEEYQIWWVNVSMSLIPHLSLPLKYFIWIFNHHLQHKFGKVKLCFCIGNFMFPSSSVIIWSPAIIFGKNLSSTLPLLTHTFVSLIFLSSCSEEHPLLENSPLSYVFQLNCLANLFFFPGDFIFSTPDFTDLLPHRWLHLHEKHCRRLMWQQEQVT